MSFLEPHFGNPASGPRVGDQRAEASIAEFLWFEIVATRVEGHRELVLQEGPSFSPLDAGGDGIAVYSTDEGYVFRLWEIKKHTAQSGVQSKISTAIDQLQERALSYLARYTSVARQLPTEDVEMRLFLTTLVEMWESKDSHTGAGIALSKSMNGEEPDHFKQLPISFPHMADGKRLEGLVSAVGKYENFADLVRRELWKGL